MQEVLVAGGDYFTLRCGYQIRSLKRDEYHGYEAFEAAPVFGHVSDSKIDISLISDGRFDRLSIDFDASLEKSTVPANHLLRGIACQFAEFIIAPDDGAVPLIRVGDCCRKPEASEYVVGLAQDRLDRSLPRYIHFKATNV